MSFGDFMVLQNRFNAFQVARFDQQVVNKALGVPDKEQLNEDQLMCLRTALAMGKVAQDILAAHDLMSKFKDDRLKCTDIAPNEEGVISFTDEQGYAHHETEPAIVTKDGKKYWYIHGKLHRDGDPAFIDPDKSMLWYKDGINVGGMTPYRQWGETSFTKETPCNKNWPYSKKQKRPE